MAGPAASVLATFHGFTPTWRELMMPFASEWDNSTSCSVSDTRAFGGTYAGDPRPFVGSVDPFQFQPDEWPDDAAISDAVCRFAGRRFTHSIVVAAMCNQAEDHRVLCEVVTALAVQISGLIDFDCLDVPDGVGPRRCTWTFDGQELWTTIGTPAEAQNWIEHPAFRMLK